MVYFVIPAYEVEGKNELEEGLYAWKFVCFLQLHGLEKYYLSYKSCLPL